MNRRPPTRARRHRAAPRRARSIRVPSSTSRLAVPSLNPNRFRGVTASEVCTRSDASGVAVDHPPQHQIASGAAHQLPQRELHGVVVPGLEDDRDVAVRQLRVQPVVGQERHGYQFLGLAICQPEPVVEQRRPDADERSTGCPAAASRRGCPSRRADRPGPLVSGGFPAISPRISSVSSCSVALRLARSLACTLNDAIRPCSGIGSVVMPAWWGPSNGMKAACGTGGAAGSGDEHPASAAPAPDRGTGAQRPGDEAAARDAPARWSLGHCSFRTPAT